jgi:hypothetical protein
MVPVGGVGERRVVSRHTQFFAIHHEWGLIKRGSADLICRSAVCSRIPTKEPQT